MNGNIGFIITTYDIVRRQIEVICDVIVKVLAMGISTPCALDYGWQWC